MHKKNNMRKSTRSAVWENVAATIDIQDPFETKSKKRVTIKGDVRDLGAEGMFFVSREMIPLEARADILIDFDTSNPGKILLRAAGKVVRMNADGVGIHFTRINLAELQRCITARMNSS